MASPAWGCLGGYRGPDWQVGNSPLILIGTIEKVEAGKIANAAKYRAPFDGGGESHRTPPTIATVRIDRIVKGRYSGSLLRIGSGPIHNSCDEDWFYAFTLGEQKLFILPYDPVDGEVALEWGGSVLELSETSMIESRVARAVAFRDTYLADLQREEPRTYAQGVRLAAEIRESAKSWPDPQRDEETGKPSDAYNKSLAELQKKLAAADVEAIRAALAIDWLADDSGHWERKQLWRDAMTAVASSRVPELDAAGERWVRKTLARAGVEKQRVENYLATVAKAKLHVHLHYPHDAPTEWSYFHYDYAGGAEILTTDFILRYHSYDRGAMLHTYAGALDSSILAKIDSKRVKPWVVSLYHNDDERLRWLAKQVIGLTPGTPFVDCVLNDMTIDGHPQAWSVLSHYRCPKETAPRLAAMIDLAETGCQPWQLATMWRSLRSGYCFEPVCIEKAMVALEAMEQAASKMGRRGESQGESHDAGQPQEPLVGALREYLEAARSDREGARLPGLSAAEFRQWFKAHPAKTKER
ncbi:MAG: hypothetical protein ABFC63_03590 [Thermoguttaceae bacterium]